MSEAVGHGFAEGHVADDFTFLVDADGFNSTMKDIADMVVA